jgi:hypothetical protein
MIEQLYVFTREGTFNGLYSNDELIRIAAALSPGLPITRRVIKTNSVLKTFYARIKKRLHLVILENNQRNDRNLFFLNKSALLFFFVEPRHKGLLSSCYVDEYGNWTHEELMSIAKYWMTNKIVSESSS